MNIRTQNKIIIPFIGILTILLFNFGCTSDYVCPIKEASEVRIGILTSLSGIYSASGLELKEAAEIAAVDVNSYLSSIGSDVRIKLVFADDNSQDALTLDKLKELYSSGVGLFACGPNSTPQLEECRAFINSNNIIMLNTYSSSTSLSVPNDNIFRLIPDNAIQAEALANILAVKGKKGVVAVCREDDFGNDLLNLITSHSAQFGFEFVSVLKYNPQIASYEEVAQKLNENLNSAVALHGEAQTAVLAITFEEVAFLMEAANDYPVLKNVKWFGTDGVAQNPIVLQSPTASVFAEMTEFTCSQYGIYSENNPISATVGAKLRAKLGDGFINNSYYCYDAIYFLGKLIGMLKTDNHDKLKQMLVASSKLEYGSIGSLSLNANGDLASAPIEFYSVKNNGSTSWKRIGKFFHATGMTVWD